MAFHITFGTYGTRLHGDARGTVDRSMNEPGDPIVGRSDAWRAFENERLCYTPVYLSVEQREFVERSTSVVCERGGWTLHTVAAQADHVHAMLSANVEPKAIRRWLKRWLGEALSERWPLDHTWWSEGGSTRWVWTDEYLESVYNYIEDQRTVRE